MKGLNGRVIFYWMYLKKLIKHKKLIKFWIFFNGFLQCTFKFNYLFLNNIHNNSCFIDLKLLVVFVKKLLPLFFNISKSEGNFLFVATRFLYAKSVFKNIYSVYGKELICSKPGVLSNFMITKHQSFSKLTFKKMPAILIFFTFLENNYILKEGKKKNIPTVGLIPSKENSILVDYPLCINSIYFYSIYFFSKLLFKIISIERL